MLYLPDNCLLFHYYCYIEHLFDLHVVCSAPQEMLYHILLLAVIKSPSVANQFDSTAGTSTIIAIFRCKIKANPVNKKILQGPLKALVPMEKKPSTVPVPFKLTEVPPKEVCSGFQLPQSGTLSKSCRIQKSSFNTNIHSIVDFNLFFNCTVYRLLPLQKSTCSTPIRYSRRVRKRHH